MFCHLSALLWFLLAFLGLPIPLFTNLIGPLVIWASKKDEFELVDLHGRESLNFQISMTIYGIILLAVSFIVLLLYVILVQIVAVSNVNSDSGVFAIALGLLAGIGWIVFVGTFGLVQLILVLLAAVKASQGEFYRYPFTLRLIPDRR